MRRQKWKNRKFRYSSFLGPGQKIVKNPILNGKKHLYHIHILYAVHLSYDVLNILFQFQKLVISGAMRLLFALSVVISLDHYLSSNQARSESAQARVPGEKIGVRFKDRSTCKI